MKKTICIILLVAIIATAMLTFVGCNKQRDDAVTIRLNEVTHSVFYAPLYVAINEGFFADEGIEIELTNGGGSDKVMTALMSGGADVGLLGPETAVYVKAGGSKNTPMVFCQLTQKDGSFLIGRKKVENFTWDMLSGKEVIGGRYGGMPAMSLEFALKKNIGLWDTVNVNYDIQFDLITASFEAGTGDYCTMFEPNASEYERLGKGYICASVGAEAGNMPYTTFMATTEFIKENREVVKAFTKAVIRGINFVHENNGEAVAKAIAGSFPSTDLEILAKSVESYKAIDAYKTTPIMSESEYNNLLDVLREAGTLSGNVKYADIIDNSIAEELM